MAVLWSDVHEKTIPWCEECGEEMEKVMSVPAKGVVR
jgi:hypothetical protein